ncbi:MAG TPA: hypothetical protein VHJ78_06635 [Actinomycetota bacterium]|nr:hypothetical protein [Actinomycetota bacterium]
MNDRVLALLLAALTVVFLVLNFTREAGTVFLLLALASGLAAAYFAARLRNRPGPQ